MNRKAIKAALAMAQNVPVQNRRAFYRSHVVTNWQWAVSEDEAAFGASVVAKLPKGCRFFHGGPAGLPVGSQLLPACMTGKDPQGLGQRFPHRLTHAYLTTSLMEAAVYAARSAAGGSGSVYRVRPIGGVEMDPESIRTIRMMLEDGQMVGAFGRAGLIEMETAFRCDRAQIEAVELSIEWAGTPEATRLAAANLVLSSHSDAAQFVGPEGWAHDL